ERRGRAVTHGHIGRAGRRHGGLRAVAKADEDQARDQEREHHERPTPVLTKAAASKSHLLRAGRWHFRAAHPFRRVNPCAWTGVERENIGGSLCASMWFACQCSLREER